MSKLRSLIELNNLEKGKRNRLEDKLKQQEYGNIEKLIDPLA